MHPDGQLCFCASVPVRPRWLQRATTARRAVPCAKMVRVRVPLAVEAPVATVHGLFADLERMAEWSQALEAVERDAEDPRYSEWKFAWRGVRLSWRAKDEERVETDGPIRWKSVSGLRHDGAVEFEGVGERKTMMTMTVDYDIADMLAIVMESAMVASFVEGAIESDLQRFRQFALKAYRRQRMEQRNV